MTIPIKELKGIPAGLEAKLKEQGIANSDQLLDAARTPKSRREVADLGGVDVAVILELANRADLARISGVAGVYADLLENAGVDTIKELARRAPENLLAKLIEINDEKKLTSRPPNLEAVADWIAQAKKLPALLEY
jgi:predicted flap endonuclease-1-like 5' DNA nuclease